MPAEFEEWILPTLQLGTRVRVYDRVDSTNTLALEFVSRPQHHGLVFLAREQPAGRGQYGRSWQAPRGSSVLMSVLLFPELTMRRPVVLTAWAAVCVCETIRELTGMSATIKWPNDVLLAGKKVCGILIEQRTTGIPELPLATVVGIGLNVKQSTSFFAEANLPLAASLASSTGRALDTDEVAIQLIHSLDERYQRLVKNDFSSLENVWKDRLELIGKSITVEAAEPRRGRLLDAAFDGLTLEADSGDIVRVPPEFVRHLHLVE